jgi:hypothetical protein
MQRPRLFFAQRCRPSRRLPCNIDVSLSLRSRVRGSLAKEQCTNTADILDCCEETQGRSAGGSRNLVRNEYHAYGHRGSVYTYNPAMRSWSAIGSTMSHRIRSSTPLTPSHLMGLFEDGENIPRNRIGIMEYSFCRPGCQVTLGSCPALLLRDAELCMRYYTLDRANALLVLHWGSNKVVVRGTATIEHDERLFPKRGPSLTRCPVVILLLEYPSVCLPIWLH